MLLAGGIGYGVLLYLLNFRVLERLFFAWFVNPKGPVSLSVETEQM